ncbi:hypothetical protein MNBD_GAMMA26-2304 [hydrothermal vent metagenome]|uniref:Uncharacterized protein n=1 Tax=hydrothermal vent metagenome TaxID=652676 RepID=A0A3B1AT05_9ZZZZ
MNTIPLKVLLPLALLALSVSGTAQANPASTKQACLSVGGKIVELSKSSFGCDLKGKNDYVCETRGAAVKCRSATIKVSANKRPTTSADKRILAKLNGPGMKPAKPGSGFGKPKQPGAARLDNRLVGGVSGIIRPPTGGACPDPAARSIQFSIVSRSGFDGRVKITGKIKNMGTAYRSNPNQQSLQLFEVPAGGRAKLVATRNFQNLNPGQETTVSWTRNWHSSSPAEGEFPPSYKINIIYAPDIRLDSNPDNDDCRNNNTKTVSGTGINALFR